MCALCVQHKFIFDIYPMKYKNEGYFYKITKFYGLYIFGSTALFDVHRTILCTTASRSRLRDLALRPHHQMLRG